MHILPVEKPLRLQNDGSLEIVFIGVGSAFTKTLYNTNLIIIKGDTHVLVDFGTTGPFSLPATTGLELGDIEYLLPTHSHCDHIGGIEPIGLWNRYVAVPFMKKKKLTMLITEEYQNILWNMSLRGGMEWNEMTSEGQALRFTDYFDVIRPKAISMLPRPHFIVELDNLRLELFATNHIPEQALDANSAFLSYGVMIDDRVLYSGDTKFDPTILEQYGSRAECIFHDTSFTPNPVHASLPELHTLDAAMKEKMYLVHYGDSHANIDVSDFAGLGQQGVRYIFD